MASRKEQSTHSGLTAQPDKVEVMETDTSVQSYNGVAFRLPALQKDTSKITKHKSKSLLGCAKNCPRELRVTAASENAITWKQKMLMLQKSNALMKHKFNKRKAEACKEEFKVRGSTTTDFDEPSLFRPTQIHGATDVLGFFVRELTELTAAIESRKSRIRTETLKGLRKLIAGVLHTMNRNQLQAVLKPLSITGVKFQNITSSVALTPRVLQKVEKREPSSKKMHFCRGCQEGGYLPWMYLYPDQEVYRTGGGYDFADMNLPIAQSEKTLTKPRDPFMKQRGKLVNTSQHRLPEKLSHKPTLCIPFDFKKKKNSMTSPKQVMRNLSSGIDVQFWNSEQSSDFEIANQEHASNSGFDLNVFEHNKDCPMNLHSESMALDSNTEKDPLTSSRRETNFSVDNDSGVISEGSSTMEIIRDGESQLEEQKRLSLQRLQQLQTKVTGLNNIRSDFQIKTTGELETKFLKKIISRSPISIGNSWKDVRAFHQPANSYGSDVLDTRNKEPFGIKKTSSVKLDSIDGKSSVSSRKKLSSIDQPVSERKNRRKNSSVSDISANFSSSLSICTSDFDAFEEENRYNFALTGSRMNPAKRHSTVTERRHKKSRGSRHSVVKHVDEPAKTTEPDISNFEKRDSLKTLSVTTDTTKNDVSAADSMMATLSRDINTPSVNISEIDDDSRFTSDKLSINETFRSDVSSPDASASFLTVDDRLTEDLAFSDVITESDISTINDLDDLPEIEEEDTFEIDDIQDDHKDEFGSVKRRRKKRRRTLQFRTEPLSTYTLRKKNRNKLQMLEEFDEDLSMLDYAARYCIISLERLSKYEHIFTSFSNSSGGEGHFHEDDENEFSTNSFGKTHEQKKLLKDYERLIYSMDMYQQKISEAERKEDDLIRERERTAINIQNANIDTDGKQALQKNLQALSTRITAVQKRGNDLLENVKKLMEKKRNIEDCLRSSKMDDETLEKLIKNSDFLGRKFTKLNCLRMSTEDLPDALKLLNTNFDDEDLKFINHVLKLPEREFLDFKAFAVVAALSERVKYLDKSIKSLLKEVDLATLERKLDKCKELYRLLSEERQDGNRTIPLENLLVELKAGGLERDHQRSVIDKLNHHGHGVVDFLDFVLYVPLFLMIHDHIVQKPFE